MVVTVEGMFVLIELGDICCYIIGYVSSFVVLLTKEGTVRIMTYAVTHYCLIRIFACIVSFFQLLCIDASN